MTITGRITWRSEVENYQTRSGEYMTIQRVRITSGADNIVATAFKDTVAMLANINEHMLVSAEVRFAAREWKTADGTVRHNTEASINVIAPL